MVILPFKLNLLAAGSGAGIVESGADAGLLALGLFATSLIARDPAVRVKIIHCTFARRNATTFELTST